MSFHPFFKQSFICLVCYRDKLIADSLISAFIVISTLVSFFSALQLLFYKLPLLHSIFATLLIIRDSLYIQIPVTLRVLINKYVCFFVLLPVMAVNISNGKPYLDIIWQNSVYKCIFTRIFLIYCKCPSKTNILTFIIG